MKKLITAFKACLHLTLVAIIFGGATTVLTACGDDPYQPDLTSPITIVSSDLLFEPIGRTGSIEVQASGPVTATVNSTWCTATVNGHVISVTVQDNTTFEGRTALLTITADGGQVQVPVQQRGMALGSLSVKATHIGNSGGRLAYFLLPPSSFLLSTEDEWIHASMMGDSLFIDIDANDDRHIRRGVLEYECAGFTGELAIAQYDMDTILGEWYLGGTMSGAPTGFRFYFTEQDGNYYMTIFRIEEWAKNPIPVDFDADRCEITFHSASVIEQSAQSTYEFFFFTADGEVAQTQEATMRASIYYNPFATSSGGSHYATLEDGGTWANGQLTGFIIYLLTSFGNTPFVQLNNPYIVWLGPIK